MKLLVEIHCEKESAIKHILKSAMQVLEGEEEVEIHIERAP